MKKPTVISLVSKEGFERSFTLEHAQNLLTYEKEKNFNNWSLSENSPFIINNGTIERRSNKANQRAGKSSKAKQGENNPKTP